VKKIQDENTGWDMIRVVWTFLTVVFDEVDGVLEPMGLHQKRIVLLALLDVVDTPAGLADVMRAPSPTVSHMLKDLEDSGLIERRVDQLDRRRFRLSRTEKGEDALRVGVEAINRVIDGRLNGIDGGRAALIRIGVGALAEILPDVPPQVSSES
jgi:DNA-binding MarR family transcriptional regulator